MSNKKALYDQDDFYDYDDDEEDYYGDYGDFDAGETQLAGKQANKPSAKVQQILIASKFLHVAHVCIMAGGPQALSKSTDKSKAKAGTKATQAPAQPTAPAGASALARCLCSRKSHKGGEAVMQLDCLMQPFAALC